MLKIFSRMKCCMKRIFSYIAVELIRYRTQNARSNGKNYCHADRKTDSDTKRQTPLLRFHGDHGNALLFLRNDLLGQLRADPLFQGDVRTLARAGLSGRIRLLYRLSRDGYSLVGDARSRGLQARHQLRTLHHGARCAILHSGGPSRPAPLRAAARRSSRHRSPTLRKPRNRPDE